MNKHLEAFQRLLNIMDDLREKCPWDRKQTIPSLRNLTLEEVYELNDAILAEDMDEIKQELGDLLLHIVFYTKIASEKEAFDMAGVIHEECDKLVERHPHVYGDVKAETEAEVKKNWQQVKRKNEGRKSVLEGVPRSLPALVKAIRIQEKVKQVGFEWDQPEQVLAKVKEEIEEFESAPAARKEEEFGDLLFALVNYARFVGIDPEQALGKINRKFKNRFQALEDKAAEEKLDIHNASLAQLDRLWDQVKEHE